MQSVKRVTGKPPVYGRYQTASSVDLCRSSWPSLQFICLPRCFILRSTLQILSQVGRCNTQTLLHFLKLSFFDVFWCSTTGNKTGGVSLPPCGLMHYCIILLRRIRCWLPLEPLMSIVKMKLSFGIYKWRGRSWKRSPWERKKKAMIITQVGWGVSCAVDR